MGNLKSGFVHTVYFWLKNPENEANQQQLLQGLKKLSSIEEIRDAYIGKPAETRREVIDSTYSLSITFVFDNAEDQDVYQSHIEHLKFIDDCSHLWQKVQVYDAFGY